MSFKDHFSTQADIYAKYRPTYPQELFDYVLGLVPNKQLAWDCATGNGQVAFTIAPFFERVIATDASENQIQNAPAHPKVRYAACTAEDSVLDNHSTDLIIVAQAIHWFNFDKFFAEVRRVGKPGSLLAIWGYGLHKIEPEVDVVVDKLYRGILEEYWPAERKHIEQRYENIPFPFEQINSPQFYITKEWTLAELCGYLRTWSSTQRFIKAQGYDPVDAIEKELQAIWGNPNNTKTITWPVFLKVGEIR